VDFDHRVHHRTQMTLRPSFNYFSLNNFGRYSNQDQPLRRTINKITGICVQTELLNANLETSESE
jgi:hypothetical protein